MYTQPPFDRFGNLTATFEPCFWSAAQQTMTVGLIRGDGGPLLPEVRELSLRKWDGLENKFHLQPEQSLSAMIHEIKAGERYDLTVTARAPWPPSGRSGRVVLATGVPEQPEYTLGFYLNGSCRLRADPKWFVREDLRSPAGGRVHLVWSDDWPPGRVVSAEADDPALLVEVLDTAEGQDVVVHAPRAYVFPKRSLCVTLHTDDNMMPELRVCVVRSRAVN